MENPHLLLLLLCLLKVASKEHLVLVALLLRRPTMLRRTWGITRLHRPPTVEAALLAPIAAVAVLQVVRARMRRQILELASEWIESYFGV